MKIYIKEIQIMLGLLLKEKLKKSNLNWNKKKKMKMPEINFKLIKLSMKA